MTNHERRVENNSRFIQDNLWLDCRKPRRASVGNSLQASQIWSTYYNKTRSKIYLHTPKIIYLLLIYLYIYIRNCFSTSSRLFKDLLISPIYIVLKSVTINEYWIEKDVEESGSGLMAVSSLYLSERTEENH